jgi:4,5-DOPA dioxygenase extradiol
MMPMLFVGHGSPINAVEDNKFTQGWRDMAARLPRPDAILFISAHWLTQGVFVSAAENPRTLHDFSGFPDMLNQFEYPAPGHPLLADMVVSSMTSTNVKKDTDRGFDHGCWSALSVMYPDARIPIVQLSLDFRRPAAFHYDVAKHLAGLRKEGVMIIGSGNLVHNLSKAQSSVHGGFPWALDMNEHVKQAILTRDHARLINYHEFGPDSRLAIPTPDHYLPLLYVVANQLDEEPVQFFNDNVVMGSISMLSFSIGLV